MAISESDYVRFADCACVIPGLRDGLAQARTTAMITDAIITRYKATERVAIERVMASFWQGRSPHTIAAYRSDLEQFSRYLARVHALPLETPQLELLRTFFSSSAGRANELVLNYRNELRDRDVARKSIK